MRESIKDILKKISKIIITNLFSLIIIIVLLEIITTGFLIYKYWPILKNTIAAKCPLSRYFIVEHFDKKNYNKHFRKPTLKANSKKGGVILFGCSYTEGSSLKDEETFAYKLSNYTNRSVYNRGLPGQGPQIMLFQLKDSNFKKIAPNADVIIYTFIEDHFNRIYKYRNWVFFNLVTLKYELVNNKLIEKDLKFPLGYFSILRMYDSSSAERHSQAEKETLLFKILEESYKKSQELYPNSRFYILIYPQDVSAYQSSARHKYIFSKSFKSSIEELGIKIISATELTNGKILDKKYQISDSDNHPNAKAWDLVVPLLAKKINL